MLESLFNKVAPKETLSQVFSHEFCVVLKNTLWLNKLYNKDPMANLSQLPYTKWLQLDSNPEPLSS